jgi:hypothetical protein
MLTERVWRLLELRSRSYKLGSLEKVTGWTAVREQELRSRDEIEADIRMGKSEERKTKLFPLRCTFSSAVLEENIFGLNDCNLLYLKSISLIF